MNNNLKIQTKEWLCFWLKAATFVIKSMYQFFSTTENSRKLKVATWPCANQINPWNTRPEWFQAAKVSSQNLQGPSVPEESGELPPGRHRATGIGSSVSTWNFNTYVLRLLFLWNVEFGQYARKTMIMGLWRQGAKWPRWFPTWSQGQWRCAVL